MPMNIRHPPGQVDGIDARFRDITLIPQLNKKNLFKININRIDATRSLDSRDLLNKQKQYLC